MSQQFTLGESTQVLQFTEQEIKDADIQLNKLLVKSFQYTFIAGLSGSVFSLFFKNKIGVIGYSAGIGLGLALNQHSSGLLQKIL